MGSLKLWVGLGVGESPEAGAGGCLPFARLRAYESVCVLVNGKQDGAGQP